MSWKLRASLCHPWGGDLPLMPVLVGKNIPPHVIPYMPRVLVHTAPQAGIHPGPPLEPAATQQSDILEDLCTKVCKVEKLLPGCCAA